jgi:hypothetical protein
MRRARGRLVAGATGATVAVLVTVAAVVLGTPSTPPGPGPTQDRSVRLVAYLAPGDPTESEEPADDPADEASLQRFASCMRREGFSLADPRLTDGGWTIPMSGPPPDTPAWREAAIVVCRPPNVHLTGDLVLGGRTASEVEAFGACLRRQGYDLPEPSRDGDEHVFDLRGATFDSDSDGFRRAAMVTCAPGLP